MNNLTIIVIASLAGIYATLIMTLTEPSTSADIMDCTYGCPLTSQSQRRSNGVLECIYRDGQLMETRSSAESDRIKICEFKHTDDGPEVRQYFVTY